MDPALLRGLIMAVLWFLASIGIAVSPDVPNALIGVLAALFAIVQALWTRPAVTPNNKVAVIVPNPEEPWKVAPGAAVTTADNTEIINAAKSAGVTDDPNAQPTNNTN